MNGARNVDDYWDLFDLMNPDCWREVLDNLPDSKDVISLAAASPDLESLFDERDEFNVALAVEALKVIHRNDKKALIQALISLRNLSTSSAVKFMIDQQLEACASNKFDMEPLTCYQFDSGTISSFLAHFEGHGRSPFVSPACSFRVFTDEAIKLLSHHGRYLRQVKLSITQWRVPNLLQEKIAGMLTQLPNIEKLVVYKGFGLDEVEPFPNEFPPCPKLKQLKTTGDFRVWPLFFKIFRAYGPQLTELSVEPHSFQLPGQDWNTFANLERLEIQSIHCFNGTGLQKMSEILSSVQWPNFKEIHLPFEHWSYRNIDGQEQLGCLQNFRDTLETVVFRTDKQENIRFGENEFQAVAAHASFPKVVEVSIIQPRIIPVPQFLQKYFAKVFPNLKRLLILRGRYRIPWRYEHVQHYSELFPILEEVKVEREEGVYTIYKRRTGPPSPVVHLPFLTETKIEQVLESLRERLAQQSNIESLALEVPRMQENEWEIEPMDLVELTPCPNLKKVDLSEVDWWLEDLDYLEKRDLMKPILGSLLASYGDQLTELSTGKEMFYADVQLDIWKKLTNLQAFRANLSSSEWNFAFEILSQVRWPQLKHLTLGTDTDVPFDLTMLMILQNFKDSLTTFQVGGWAIRQGPRVWIDEEHYVLPNLTKLVVSQNEGGGRHNTEIWSKFSTLVPNLWVIQFVNSGTGLNQLGTEDMNYFSGLFGTVAVIQLVDMHGKQLDIWRRRAPSLAQ